MRILAGMIAALVALGAQAPSARADRGAPSELRRVGPGTLPSFLARDGEASVEVRAFALEDRPVTRAQYRAFVAASPRWRAGAVPSVLAEPSYLAGWSPSEDDGALPATEVSWHAARAYCRSHGRRLPTESEWEWAARADATRADATGDPAHARAVLDWYARRGRVLRASGSGAPNVWGVRDLHGLVWEWVEDFGASMVASDDRERDARDGDRVCGAGALGGGDPGQYATFMRFAFRSSLRASFALPQLGFRCAADLEGDQEEE